MTTPICMDCKHMRCGILSDKRFSRCKSPKNPHKQEINHVSGGYVDFHIEYCSVIRGSSRQEMCGPEGKWFEQKESMLMRLSKVIGWA